MSWEEEQEQWRLARRAARVEDEQRRLAHRAARRAAAQALEARSVALAEWLEVCRDNMKQAAAVVTAQADSAGPNDFWPQALLSAHAEYAKTWRAYVDALEAELCMWATAGESANLMTRWEVMLQLLQVPRMPADIKKRVVKAVKDVIEMQIDRELHSDVLNGLWCF
jgi:hypothetical protein